MTDAQWSIQARIVALNEQARQEEIGDWMEGLGKLLEMTLAKVLGLYAIAGKAEEGEEQTFIPAVFAFGNHHLIQGFKDRLATWNMTPEVHEAFEAFSSTLHKVAQGAESPSALGPLAHLAQPAEAPTPYFETEAFQQALARLGLAPADEDDLEAPVVTQAAPASAQDVLKNFGWTDGNG